MEFMDEAERYRQGGLLRDLELGVVALVLVQANERSDEE